MRKVICVFAAELLKVFVNKNYCMFLGVIFNLNIQNFVIYSKLLCKLGTFSKILSFNILKLCFADIALK